jgi:hypothetical protein
MSKKEKGSQPKDPDQRKSILNRLFSKPSRDETYLSDLKTQWAELDSSGRAKFVLGALIGVIVFIGALILAYFVLSALIGAV